MKRSVFIRISRNPALVSRGVLLSSHTLGVTARNITLMRGLVYNNFISINVNASGNTPSVPSPECAPCRAGRKARITKFVAVLRKSSEFCGGVFIRGPVHPYVRSLTSLVNGGKGV